MSNVYRIDNGGLFVEEPQTMGDYLLKRIDELEKELKFQRHMLRCDKANKEINKILIESIDKVFAEE